ncbi:MAG: NAD-dependent deacylase [Gemmatimonadales bacterium]|jgi:NAD-dependent deacetylase
MSSDDGDLDRAAEWLAGADLVVAATGAGMSKESGIPTFRDAQDGLWARYRPEELATRGGFRGDPARVWGWYNYRRRLIARCEPHAGHNALADLERLVPQLIVVTQNIDGLHVRSGSSTVLELHGNINRFKCFEQDHPADVDVAISHVEGSVQPPTCSICGSPLRPDVVWFGEMLPPGVFERAESLAVTCDVMLVVGTSGIVYPAAALPAAARAGGAKVVEVNVERSELTHSVDIFLEGAAGVVLPELVARVETRKAIS